MSLFDGLSTPSWITPQDNDKASWQTSKQFGEIFNAAKDRAQQIALNAPLRAAQISEADASVKATQLGIIQKQGLIDAGIQAKAGEAALAQVASQISSQPGGWLDPNSEKRVWEVAAQSPALMESPVFKRTIDLFSAAGKAEAGRQAAENRADAAEERNKTLLAIAGMKTGSAEKVAQIGADAKTYVADTRADSYIANQQNKVLIESMKDQASMDRLKTRLHNVGDSIGMSKDQAGAYHAALHNAFTFSAQNNQTPEESAAAVNAVMKRFGVAMPGDVSSPSVDKRNTQQNPGNNLLPPNFSLPGKAGDPLNLFGPK